MIGPSTEILVRQRQDPHRRRDRLPRAPHLPAARRRGARRRASPRSSAAAPARPRAPRPPRSRPARGTSSAHARRRSTRWPRQRGAARQGQHRVDEARSWEQVLGGAVGLQAARGLGHHAGGDRRLPARRRRDRACRSPSTPTRSTRPATCESTLAAIAGRSIHTYHTEGAGGGHAPDIITVAVAPERAAVVDQPDPAAHGQHRRRAPRHVDGVPPPQPVGPRGPGVRREPRSGRRPSPPRTSSTTSARSRSSARTRRRWVASARWSCARGRPRT